MCLSLGGFAIFLLIPVGPYIMDAFSYLAFEVGLLDLAHLSPDPPLYSKSHGLSLKAAHGLGDRERQR